MVGPRRRQVVVGGLAALALVACGDRFRPNTPKRLSFSDPNTAYSMARAVVERRGYRVEEADPGRYFISVVAKLDQPDPERLSFIEMQVYRDGQLHMTAHGFHTRGDRAHRKLRAEMEQLAEALRVHGGATRLPAYAPAS